MNNEEFERVRIGRRTKFRELGEEARKGRLALLMLRVAVALGSTDAQDIERLVLAEEQLAGALDILSRLKGGK